MASQPPSNDVFIVGAQHLQAAKYFQLCAYVLLIYDYCLTFSKEVEQIWKSKLTGATGLFLINRYITPLQFIIIIVAFHDPRWTYMACRDFVVFEGASTVGLIAVTELIMILRVYALYNRNRVVLIGLLILWSLQIIFSSVGLRDGYALDLPRDLVGCIFTGDSAMMACLWVTPLVTNSVIFFLTLFRSRKWKQRTHSSAPIIHVLVRDGTIYFLVIFMANLLNTLFYVLAVEDLKAIGASFSQLITSMMISRLVLNLRSASNYPGLANPRMPTAMGDRVVGQLGGVLETFLDTGQDDYHDGDIFDEEHELSNITDHYRYIH